MLQLDPFFEVAALLMILKSLSEKVELTVSEARIVTSLPIFISVYYFVERLELDPNPFDAINEIYVCSN